MMIVRLLGWRKFLEDVAIVFCGRCPPKKRDNLPVSLLARRDALNQLLDITTAFSFFNLYLSVDRFNLAFELHLMNLLPRSTSSRIPRTTRIVIFNTSFNIFCPANVISIYAFTVKYVNMMHRGRCRARTYDLCLVRASL